VRGLISIYFNRKTFFRGSAVLAFTALASNLLGLLRDRLLARHFGAGAALDAYNAAFIVPNLLLNIFVAGALTAAFVPIFSGLISKERRHEAAEFANSVLNSSILVVLITGLAAFFFAPQLSHWVVPGFTPESKILFVNLMRLLLLSPLIFAVSNALGNILVSEERFFWYGISPSLYNIGIIGGVIFLAGRFGIYGVIIGVIGGALLHLTSRLIGLARLGFAKQNLGGYRPKIKVGEHFKKYIRLMLPRMAGQPIEQVMFLGFTVIASTIGTGAIVALNFANNFQTVPVAIIGITFALTAFPVLSKIAAGGNKKAFTDETIFTTKAILITTAPIAAFMYFFSRPIIAILIGGGAFDKAAIAATAATLAAFTPSIITESVNHLLARAFYALKNSAAPTLIAFGGLVITLVSAYGLAKTMGVPGLALGFFLGSVFKIVLHFVFLKTQTKKAFAEKDLLTEAVIEE
jgi:putative peptidoglycan lipid II flippase